MNVSFGLFTIGSALFLTVPISFIFLLALQFVHYFEDNEMKYFISVHDIAGSAEAVKPAEDLITAEDSLDELNRKINEPAAAEPAEKEDGSSEE